MKAYLGDSVYVDYVGGMLKLTTENGLPHDPSNTIYLEDSVYAALVEYVRRLQHNDPAAYDDGVEPEEEA